MKNPETSGWDWFTTSGRPANDDQRVCFQDCFKTPSGQSVLKHLRRHFLERRVGPSASADELRHLEGARHAIAYIERLAAPSVMDRSDD